MTLIGTRARPGLPNPMAQFAMPSIVAPVQPPVSAASVPMPNLGPEIANARGPSIMDRLGGALSDPATRAALFRSGAATFNGGLGAGLNAAAGYMDQRKASDAAATQQGFENNMAQFKMAHEQQVAAQQARDRAADASKVRYQVIPDKGAMVGMYGDGSLVDPVAAAPYVKGGEAPQPGAPTSPTAPQSAFPRVGSTSDYDALPVGAEFMTPTGERRRKAGATQPGSRTFP